MISVVVVDMLQSLNTEDRFDEISNEINMIIFYCTFYFFLVYQGQLFFRSDGQNSERHGHAKRPINTTQLHRKKTIYYVNIKNANFKLCEY